MELPSCWKAVNDERLTSQPNGTPKKGRITKIRLRGRFNGEDKRYRVEGNAENIGIDEYGSFRPGIKGNLQCIANGAGDKSFERAGHRFMETREPASGKTIPSWRFLSLIRQLVTDHWKQRE
ncbi:hypothetical protein K0M31_014567 [Melipona bicolor]|uniref:Uncharacterized protein n=1 Tax=Melipona bicolor TaxID=60889 RepID=A0AA40KUN2_9HYME|nr:hypothetical protein K0M31_014567 [Melipona bicolor]